MAYKLAFELVAPERLLASIEADMVVIPGADGDFGVLPLHAPLMSLLRPGVIAVRTNTRRPASCRIAPAMIQSCRRCEPCT